MKACSGNCHSMCSEWYTYVQYIRGRVWIEYMTSKVRSQLTKGFPHKRRRTGKTYHMEGVYACMHLQLSMQWYAHSLIKAHPLVILCQDTAVSSWPVGSVGQLQDHLPLGTWIVVGPVEEAVSQWAFVWGACPGPRPVLHWCSECCWMAGDKGHQVVALLRDKKG